MLTNVSSLSPALLSTAEAPSELLSRPNNEQSDEADLLAKAEDLKKTFSQFAGETFFGQLMKSMRNTVGEPAYFHGGMAERQFQAQLDQQIAQDMASSGAADFADGMFRQQFPEEAALLDAQQAPADQLSQLDALRRR